MQFKERTSSSQLLVKLVVLNSLLIGMGSLFFISVQCVGKKMYNLRNSQSFFGLIDERLKPSH